MDHLPLPNWSPLFPVLVIVFGMLLLIWALRLAREAWRDGRRRSMHALTWMRGFRLAILGLALAAGGLAWLTGERWLLVLALGIGGEELLESSLAISALRRAPAPPSLTHASGREP